MSIGKLIKKYREENKISQRKLAELSNVSFSYIQQLEKGQKENPGIEILNKIAAALNIKVTDFFPSKKIPLQSLIDLTGASKQEIIDSNGKKKLITSIPNGKEKMEQLYKSLEVLSENIPKDKDTENEINNILSKAAEIVKMDKSGEIEAIPQEELYKSLFSKFPYMDSTNKIIFKDENMKIAFEHFKILINYCNNFKGIPEDKKSIEKYCEMFLKTLQYITDELQKLNEAKSK